MMNAPECQIQCFPIVASGDVELTGLSPRQRLKLFLKRRLDAQTKRSLKKRLNRFYTLFSRLTSRKKKTEDLPLVASAAQFKAGDFVRVRSREEIVTTLNFWNEHKSCGFMPEMWSYCGSVQRVLKPVERFLDERDYKMKKCTGIVLLEGAICQGSATLGRCDRSCFFFWREEWLEKIEEAG
jgi:hypothetical protein